MYTCACAYVFLTTHMHSQLRLHNFTCYIFLVLYRTCTDNKLRFQAAFETACHAEDTLSVTIMNTGLSVVNTLACVSQHPTTNQLFPGSAVDCTDRPMLLNITCDCSGCLSVSSTTCSASCFMWFEESRGHSRLVLIRNIAADSSGYLYLLLSDLTQQTCHGDYSPSRDELMCCVLSCEYILNNILLYIHCHMYKHHTCTL